MQNSKKVLIVTFIIIMLVIISIVCITTQGNNTDRVAKIYKEILEKQTYTFSMEETNSEYEYMMAVSQKGNDINIDTGFNDEHTSTLILEGHVYVLMHNKQEYYVMDSDDIDADIIISGLKEVSEKEYDTGKEEINGKTYYYEEYKDVSSFIMLLQILMS